MVEIRAGEWYLVPCTFHSKSERECVIRLDCLWSEWESHTSVVPSQYVYYRNQKGEYTSGELLPERADGFVRSRFHTYSEKGLLVFIFNTDNHRHLVEIREEDLYELPKQSG